MAEEDPKTQPLDMTKLIAGLEDAAGDVVDVVVGKDGKTPEPVVVRAALMAVVGLIGGIVGHKLNVAWVDPALTLYGLVGSPLLLAMWARRHVTPVKQ